MKSGFTIGIVPADTSEQAARGQQLDINDDTRYSRIEVYAPKTGYDVTGNTSAVWLGDENMTADEDHQAGVYLVPGDSYEFTDTQLTEVYLAAITDGDKVTWMAYP